MPKSQPARRSRLDTAPPNTVHRASVAKPANAGRQLWWQRRDGHSNPIRRHAWFLYLSIALLVGWMACLAALAFWAG
jgi:hypothetical protein